MSHIEVNILHQAYVLTCPKGQEAQLREAAEHVDTQFQRIRNSSKLRSREQVGVLLAVNLAYENLELRNQLQALQLQITALQADHTLEDAAQPADNLPSYDTAAAHALIARIDTALAASSAQAQEDAHAIHQDPCVDLQEYAAGEIEQLQLAKDAQAKAAPLPQLLAIMDTNTMTSGNDNAPNLPATTNEAL